MTRSPIHVQWPALSGILLRAPGIAALLFMAASCANIVSPSGGPKDTTPPQVVEATPYSGSVNFQGNSFTLLFNEYIQLGNLQQNILISPPLHSTPAFKLRGKSLTVRFSDTLLPNTTYAFHLGEEISDITERNPMRYYSYFLATGDRIDSLMITGNVRNAWDNKVGEKIHVMLFKASDPDSAFAKEKPRYITKVDKSGTFTLNHLAEGSYLLVALSDMNNNLLYDLPTEAVAFLGDPALPAAAPPGKAAADSIGDTLLGASPLQTPVMYNLAMFIAEDSIQRILTARSYGKYKVVMAFRYPVRKPNVTITDTLLQNLSGIQWNERSDTLTIWLRKHARDTLPLIISGATFSDTLAVPLRPRAAGPRGRQVTDRLLFTMNTVKGGKLHPSVTPEIIFDRPLASLNTNGVLLAGSTDTFPLQMTPADTLFAIRYIIDNLLQPGQQYQVILPAGAGIAWDGTTHDTLRWEFGYDLPESYGTLHITLTTDSTETGDILLQLLDEKFNLLEMRKVIPGETETFHPLKPGKYNLKAISDNNGNGRWDTGDFWKRIQPERVSILKTPPSIRENWEEEVEWKVDFKYQ